MKTPLQIGKKLEGHVHGDCPHCGQWRQFERYELQGSISGVPVPSGEILQCQFCQQYARRESRVTRILSAVFLIPFAILLGGGIGTGGYILWILITGSMLWSWGFLLIAVLLLGCGGFFEYRVVKRIYQLVMSEKFLPLHDLFTQL